MLVLLLGVGAQAVYQVMFLEDQLATVTAQVDQMDARVKWAEYSQNKFFSLSKSVQMLAPKDPSAAQIARDFKIRTSPLTPMDSAFAPTPLNPSGATSNSPSDVPPTNNPVLK